MPVVRISEGFFTQLEKAQGTLSVFLGRDVTIKEISEKLYLKVIVKNKSPLNDDMFAQWEVRPVVILVNGVIKRKQICKRAMLQSMGKFVPKKKKQALEYDFVPAVENLWK